MPTVGYCERCGSPLCEGVRFCDRCGADQGEAIRRLREVVRSVEVRRNQYHEELGALRAEADTLTVSNVQLKKDNEALELQKHAMRTELLTLATEEQQTKRELDDLTQSRNVIKTEISQLEASARSLKEDIEKLNQAHFVAEGNMGALRQQVGALTERIDELREEAESLNAYVLDLSKRRETTEAEVDLLRAEHARLLANVKKERITIEGLTDDLSSLSSSAGEHLAKVRGRREAREEAAVQLIDRRVKVALLIFVVVGVSFLAAVSLHAPNPSIPATSTETYFSVGTSTITVTSQLSATSQASTTGSELLMPVFGRWVTRNVTVQVNNNSGVESWILMRAIDTWNGAEGNFSGGTPPYELSEVTGEAQITVNFVSALPANLDASTTCQQTNLPPGSFVNGVFTSCVIQMSKEIFTVSEEQLAYRLALHELGHALGLGTLMGSTDLMDAAGWQQATGISTLDLYALQTISTVGVDAGAPSFIGLSENAPYRVVSESL